MLADLVKRSQPLAGNARLLILGGGYSGSCVAQLATALGTPVLCTRRSPGADLIFDSATASLPDPQDLGAITHVLSTIPPDRNGGDPVLSHLLPLLSTLPLRWAGYLSTTGVYGDRQGEWVSETDAPNPGLDRSRRRLDCEQRWLDSGLPVQILRLPGIYGPGRSVLDSLRQGRARLIVKPDQVFCRIHVEDIAGAVWHLIHHAAAGRQPALVNVVDDLPAPSAEQLRFAATLLNSSLPKEEVFADIRDSMSPMAVSFWSENRRVSNRRLCGELGYQLLHPDYRSGLQDCMAQDRLNP